MLLGPAYNDSITTKLPTIVILVIVGLTGPLSGFKRLLCILQKLYKIRQRLELSLLRWQLVSFSRDVLKIFDKSFVLGPHLLWSAFLEFLIS